MENSRLIPLFAAVLVLASRSSEAAEPKVVLRFDHSEGMFKDLSGEVVDSTWAIRVARSNFAAIEVTNTNTLAFRCALEADKLEDPSASALRTALAAAKPYFLEFRHMMAGVDLSGEEEELWIDVAEVLRQYDHAVDDVFLARESIAAAFRKVATASASDLNDAKCMAEKDDLAVLVGEDGVPKSVGNLNDAFRALREKQKKLADREKETTLLDLEQAISSRLAKHAEVRALGETLQQTIEGIRKASNTQVLAKTFRIRWGEGAKVTLECTARDANITPKELAPVKKSITLLGEFPLRFAAGLNLAWAFGAKFPVYGAVGGKVAEVTTKSYEASWLLSLSVIPSALDWREQHGLAPALDIVLNPSDTVRSAGIGFSLIAFRFLKVGGGMLLTRHDVLNTEKNGLGAEILSGDVVETKRQWTPTPFVAVSLVGIPPFDPK